MIRKITLLAFIFSLSNASAQSITFTDKANCLTARGGAAAAMDEQKNHVYVANGFSATNGFTTEIERYNLVEDWWALFPTTTPTIAKRYGSMQILANTMYLFNGITNTGYNDKLESIDLNTGALTVNTNLNPNPVYSAGSAILGDYLISFGGCSNRFNAIFSNKLYKITPWGTWTALADMPVGLETKGEVMYGNGSNSKLYVFGGYKEINATKENFETIVTANNIEITDWINVAEVGTKLYKGKLFGGNKYAEISAFSNNVAAQEASNVSWLISNPIVGIAANQAILNFDTKDGFNNGATLQAYLITNWNGDIASATKTELNATIATGTTSGFAVNFTNSGEVQLPGDATNYRIGFKYVGGYAPVTASTTYQIDNVRVYQTSISNNIYIYDFTSDSWTTSNTVLPQSLSAYALAKDDVNNDKIYITGDYSNQTFTGVYNTANDTFTALTPTNMIGRRHHTSAFLNNKLYIFGGNTTPSSSSVLSSTQSADVSTLATEAFVTNEAFTVYPNPATDVVTVTEGIINVAVYTIDGKKINLQQNQNTLNIAPLSKGMYVLYGENQQGNTFTTKLVKE
jgi:Secretion system C-terminal sorting domain